MIATLGLLWGAALGAPYRTDHHHAEYDWVTLETRFLRIHTPAPSPDGSGDALRTADAVAAVGDEVVLRLADAIGAIPRGPIHVVVTDEADEMTAYTLPSWGWVVLSADPGSAVLRLRGRQDWVPDSLAHELAHLVSHQRAASLAPTASYGFELTGVAEGGGTGASATATFAPNVPYGWSEGAAEWWSERIGVNRWSAGRAATLRTTALGDRLLDYDEWWVSVDKGDVLDGERAYQQGYAFARWLSETYGEDTLPGMAAAAARRYPLSWPALLRAQTGEPPRVTFARWRASAWADAAAQAARLRAAGITEGIELERWVGEWSVADLDARDRWLRRTARDREEAREATGAFELYPRTSPDGRWLALARGGWVYAVRGSPSDPTSGSSTALRQRRAARTAAWIPAMFGSSYAFVPGREALVVATEPDAERGPLGRGSARDVRGALALVDLTPQSRSVRHRGGHTEIEVLDLSRRRQRRARIRHLPGTERARDPAVSPDGTKLAWLAYRDGTTELVVAELDGSSPRTLSSFGDGTWLQHPSWSPDGRAIVVSALRTDRPDLWRVDVDTGAWTQLTADPQDELDPVWTADGIWFVSDPDDVFDVYRLDPDSGRVERMTRELGGAHTPWPLPDGDLLYASQTAHGFKAVRLPGSERLDLPTPGVFGPPPPPEVSAADLAFRPAPSGIAPRPYRPLRSLLVPAVGPVLRIDGIPARVTPLGGAYVKVRDAVERVEASALGLVGEDLLGEAQLTWRGLPPELTLWAQGASDLGPRATPLGRRSLGQLGLDARFRLRSWASLELGPARFATADRAGPRLASWRASGRLALGEPSADDGPGASLTATRAWSTRRPDLGPSGAWNRLEAEAHADRDLPVRTGPLAEHRHTIELAAYLGGTDRAVSPEERLYAGGDVPGALRVGAPSPSIPLPGFAPYALGGRSLGVARATWVVPVLPRLRTLAGPLYLRELALGLGTGGGIADRGQELPLAAGSLWTEARLSALLLDATWDSALRLAWGFGPASASPWVPPGVAPAGPRLTLSLGTGFR